MVAATCHPCVKCYAPMDNVVGPSPDHENAFSAISGDEAARACTGLVNKPPSSHTGTPKILSRSNSALPIEHPRSVPVTHPPSHAATPLMHNASVTGKEGSAALMKLESATASPELPSCSSQEDGSQLGQTNENFQSSRSSPIHRMTLKYSDEDEVTDEEMRELNLQAATIHDAAGCTEFYYSDSISGPSSPISTY